MVPLIEGVLDFFKCGHLCFPVGNPFWENLNINLVLYVKGLVVLRLPDDIAVEQGLEKWRYNQLVTRVEWSVIDTSVAHSDELFKDLEKFEIDIAGIKLVCEHWM